MQLVFSVPSTCSGLQMETLYNDIQSIAQVSEFMLVKEHISLCLGYFLETSKKNSKVPLHETMMIMPMLSANLQMRRNMEHIEEEFNLIRTDIRSMCYLENNRKVIIELNGESLQVLLFSIKNKSVLRRHQTKDTQLGIKTVSEKIWGYLRRFCEERGIQDDNEVKTKAHVDNLVHSYFVLEHFEQSDFKNIRIRDGATGKIHHYKIYLDTVKRLYKQYMCKVEAKIKRELKKIFFESIKDVINFRTRLIRPLEEITFSEKSFNVSKNQNGRSQIGHPSGSKLASGGAEPGAWEHSQIPKKRITFTNQSERKGAGKQSPFPKGRLPRASSRRRESKVFSNKSELLTSKYLKSIKKNLASTLNINESSKNASVARNKSQINQSKRRNKSRLTKTNKSSKPGHRKRATVTHFPVNSSQLSTQDHTMNQTIDLGQSHRKSPLAMGLYRTSILDRSNLQKDLHGSKVSIQGLHADADNERPDVMGKFRQKYTRTQTSIKDDAEMADLAMQNYQTNHDDKMIIQDLCEFLEIFNGEADQRSSTTTGTSSCWGRYSAKRSGKCSSSG